MPAGQFKAPTLSLSGEKSVEFFVGLYAQKLFLATAGVSFDVGLTYPAIGDIYVKRAMVKAASHVYLLADSTKIGRVSFSALGGVEMVHTLITDDGIAALARIAAEVNEAVENIGARRLQTVMEKLLEEVSFTAEDRAGETVTIDAAFVEAQLAGIARNADLSRYVL